MKTKRPLLSICCLTYNQENYIKDTIEGFLIQKTTFPFEIIIHDDASTDNTASIIMEYEKNIPDLFVSVYQSKNQYSRGIKPLGNFVFPLVRGKYIALCEGDDYWTDPYKLQKQVDFLEANSEYGLVHTAIQKYIQDKDEIISPQKHQDLSYYEGELYDKLLIGNNIATLTVLFRKSLLKEINLDDISKFKMGDKFLWLEIARKAKIGYINKCTGVYRVRDDSISGHNNPVKREEFITSSFDLVYYFIDKYDCKLETKETVFRKVLSLGFALKSLKLYKKGYLKLRELGKINNLDRIKLLALNNSLLYFMVRVSHKVFMK